MCAKLFGKGSHPVSSFFYLSTTFLNHCTGSLSDTALCLRSAHTITYQALSSKQVYLHLLLTSARDSPDSFSHLILIYFSFFLSCCTVTLWNSLSANVKSVGNITTFRHKLKTTFELAYPPPQLPNNWSCLSITNCLTPFVLVLSELWSPEDFSAIEVFYIVLYHSLILNVVLTATHHAKF